MNLISSLAFFIFVQVTLLVPGYALAGGIKSLKARPGIKLSLAYLISLSLIALLSTAAYALRLPLGLTRTITWLVIIAGVFLFIKQRLWRELAASRLPLICLVLMSLFSLAFIGLTFNQKYSFIPDPEFNASRNYQVLHVKVLNVAQTNANDNYIPYRQAQFFLNRSDPAKDSFIGEWGVGFFQRTPLMGAVTAGYLNLFGEKPPVDYTWSKGAADKRHTYLQFQIIAQILNALFIVPAFFTLRKLFNKKVAALTCLFLVISPFFLYNAIFSWPKSFVAFFVLTAWLLLFENKRSFTYLAGVAGGLAYLTHDLAVLYIGATLILLLYNRRPRDSLIFVITSFLFAIPWLATSALIYHSPSSFIYYPFSTAGIPQETGRAVLRQFLHTPPSKIIGIRLDSLYYLLSPYQLIYSEGGQEIGARLWALSLFSIPGAVGFGLIIPALLGVFKKLAKLGFWILVLGPVVLCALIIGWPKGLGALHFAEAVVVLLSGLGVAYLTSLKRAFWFSLAFLAQLAQLVFFIIYSYKNHPDVWFKHGGDILRLFIMAAISAFVGWSIYQIATNRRDPVAS